MNTINNTINTTNNKTIEEKEPLLNQENQEKLYPDLDNLTNSPETSENLEPTDNKENTKTSENTENTKTTEPKETTQLIDYTEPKNNKSIYTNCIYVFPFIIFLIVIISILKFKT